MTSHRDAVLPPPLGGVSPNAITMFPPPPEPPAEAEAGAVGAPASMNPDLAALYAELEAEGGDFVPEEEDTDPGCSCEGLGSGRPLVPSSGTMVASAPRSGRWHSSSFPTQAPPDEAPSTQPGGFLEDESPTDEFPPVTDATPPPSMFRTLRSPPPAACDADDDFEAIFEQEVSFRAPSVVSWPVGVPRELRGGEPRGAEAGEAGEVKTTIRRGLVLRLRGRGMAGWGFTPPMNRYAVLENRDYTLILDRSGSMMTADMPGGRSRWLAAQESTLALAAKCEQLDPDGITVYLFSGKFRRFENVTSQKVQTIFQENDPMGSTNLAAVLQHALDSYFQRKAAGQTKANGELILIVTDGEPDDQRAVMKAIIDGSRKMDRDEELGLSFIQIGRDAGATRFLKALDDELVRAGAKFDIVDTITLEDMEDLTMNEILLNALND